jgi:hypothetical protein
MPKDLNLQKCKIELNLVLGEQNRSQKKVLGRE